MVRLHPEEEQLMGFRKTAHVIGHTAGGAALGAGLGAAGPVLAGLGLTLIGPLGWGVLAAGLYGAAIGLKNGIKYGEQAEKEHQKSQVDSTSPILKRLPLESSHQLATTKSHVGI
jgi:hypothetical protein